MIATHEEIVPQCKGCFRVVPAIWGGRQFICARHPYPRMQWICETTCADFFVQKDKDIKKQRRNKI